VFDQPTEGGRQRSRRFRRTPRARSGGPTTARPRSNRLTDAPAGAPMRMGQPAPGAARRPAASASPAT